MKNLLSLVGLFVCLLTSSLSRSAQADTIKTFVLNGNYSPIYSGTGIATGSFTLNVDTGDVLAINFDYVGRSLGTMITSTYVGTFGGVTELSVGYGSSGTTRTGVSVYLPITTLVGYTGGFICSVARPCFVNSTVDNFNFRPAQFQDGDLSLAPEPSSFSYMLLSVACLASLPYIRQRLQPDAAK